jgi:hypothetical protein
MPGNDHDVSLPLVGPESVGSIASHPCGASARQ